jgi:hypothetical protein
MACAYTLVASLGLKLRDCMPSTREAFSPLERFIVVAIVLIVAAVAIQHLLCLKVAATEQTIRTGADEYSTLRTLYMAKYAADSSRFVVLRPNATSVVTTINMPGNRSDEPSKGMVK